MMDDVLDLKREYQMLGPKDEAGQSWALQDGRIFNWSESNCCFQFAWWLNPDGTPRSDYPNKQHIENLCRDRPFDPKWLRVAYRATEVYADKTMPFRIGSDHCPGFSKFLEETGEANQILGKIQGFGGFGVHWDGQNLKPSLEKELADVLAAIGFIVEHNDLDHDAIFERSAMKLERFNTWHDNIQHGRPPNENVVYAEDE